MDDYDRIKRYERNLVRAVKSLTAAIADAEKLEFRRDVACLRDCRQCIDALREYPKWQAPPQVPPQTRG